MVQQGDWDLAQHLGCYILPFHKPCSDQTREQAWEQQKEQKKEPKLKKKKWGLCMADLGDVPTGLWQPAAPC